MIQALVQALGAGPRVGSLADAAEPAVGQETHADRQDETAAGQVVDGHALTRHLPRPAPGKWGEQGADADAFSAHREGRQHDPWVVHVVARLGVAVEVYAVPVEDTVPARLLGLGGQCCQGVDVATG
jgi:hypothetical protein